MHQTLDRKIAIAQLNSQAAVDKYLDRALALMEEAFTAYSPDMIALPKYALCLTGNRAASLLAAQELGKSAALQTFAGFAQAHSLYVIEL